MYEPGDKLSESGQLYNEGEAAGVAANLLRIELNKIALILDDILDKIGKAEKDEETMA